MGGKGPPSPDQTVFSVGPCRRSTSARLHSSPSGKSRHYGPSGLAVSTERRSSGKRQGTRKNSAPPERVITPNPRVVEEHRDGGPFPSGASEPARHTRLPSRFSRSLPPDSCLEGDHPASRPRPPPPAPASPPPEAKHLKPKKPMQGRYANESCDTDQNCRPSAIEWQPGGLPAPQGKHPPRRWWESPRTIARSHFYRQTWSPAVARSGAPEFSPPPSGRHQNRFGGITRLPPANPPDPPILPGVQAPTARGGPSRGQDTLMTSGGIRLRSGPRNWGQSAARARI